MLDLKFLRENPEIVKQNIRNKFQDAKLPLVDEVIALDEENRKAKGEADALRANRNKVSKLIGAYMAQGKKAEAEEAKKQVTKRLRVATQLAVPWGTTAQRYDKGYRPADFSACSGSGQTQIAPTACTDRRLSFRAAFGLFSILANKTNKIL